MHANHTFYDNLAWLLFAATWRQQSELNRQLLAGRTAHNKSRFAMNLLHARQVNELNALRQAFEKQRTVLVSQVEQRCEGYLNITRFLRVMGLR